MPAPLSITGIFTTPDRPNPTDSTSFRPRHLHFTLSDAIPPEFNFKRPHTQRRVSAREKLARMLARTQTRK